MDRNELMELLKSEGLDDTSTLDEVTHEAAGSLASNANNGGLEAQLDFLTKTCGWSYEDIMAAAL